MNEITLYAKQLPDNLQDLSKFILVAQEKVTAIRAEIRAIDKLELAEEVRRQKAEEAQFLTEALVDAQVRVGQLTPKIEKDTSFKGNRHILVTSTQDEVTRKSKAEAIKGLGFSKDQVSDFEKMAKHPDLVEQAKAEARDEGEPVTRSRVLRLIDNKKKQESIIDVDDIAVSKDGVESNAKVVDFISEKQKQIIDAPEGKDPYEYIEFCTKAANKYTDVIYGVLTVPTSDEWLNAWSETLDGEVVNHQKYIGEITRAIGVLNDIRAFLMNRRLKN